jgi:HAD superfamily hydrolase (TIGR01509 family)
MPIKAILFDMGGVLLQMEDETPRQALAAELNIPLNKIYWAIFDSPSAKRAGVGLLTIQEHWQRVTGYLGLAPGDMADFQRRFWSADQVDRQLVGFARLLRRHYKVGLLSNAWDNLRTVIEAEWGITDAFDELIISAEVRLGKPDPRIYRLAVARLSVAPRETVFIDDVLENVLSARAVGLQAIQFKTRTQTLLDLQRLLAANNPEIPLEIENGIQALLRNTVPTQHIAHRLVEMQVRLEYQVDQRRLTPFPGSSEQAVYLVHQVPGGYLAYLHHAFPMAISQELANFGPEKAFSAMQGVIEIVAAYRPCQPSGPYLSYYFPYTPDVNEFPQVRQTNGRFEIWADGQPVSWAWSVRENDVCAEAAVETLPGYRQRGYARQVTAAWANAIACSGRTAFFSHAKANLASQALACSLGLVQFSTCVGFE